MTAFHSSGTSTTDLSHRPPRSTLPLGHPLQHSRTYRKTPPYAGWICGQSDLVLPLLFSLGSSLATGPYSSSFVHRVYGATTMAVPMIRLPTIRHVRSIRQASLCCSPIYPPHPDTVHEVSHHQDAIGGVLPVDYGVQGIATLRCLVVLRDTLRWLTESQLHTWVRSTVLDRLEEEDSYGISQLLSHEVFSWVVFSLRLNAQQLLFNLTSSMKYIAYISVARTTTLSI